MGMKNLVLIWGNKLPFSYLRPAWSLDEKYLAFGAWDWAETTPPYHIYIIDMAGVNVHRLTANEVPPEKWFFRTSCESRRPEYTKAEQIKMGATIHLAFDELETIDLAFGLAVTPGK
jgi:hypothetical protein